MEVRYWQMDEERMTEILNQAKDLVIEQMNFDGIINKEKADELSKEYSVVLAKPNLLSKFFKRKKHCFMILKTPTTYMHEYMKEDKEDK